jgi:hypothetical protein
MRFRMIVFWMLDLSCVQAMCWSGRVGSSTRDWACMLLGTFSVYFNDLGKRRRRKLETSILCMIMPHNCDTCFGTIWRALYVSLRIEETTSVFHTDANREVPGSVSAHNTATRVKKDKLKSRFCCSQSGQCHVYISDAHNPIYAVSLQCTCTKQREDATS